MKAKYSTVASKKPAFWKHSHCNFLPCPKQAVFPFVHGANGKMMLCVLKFIVLVAIAMDDAGMNFYVYVDEANK